MQRFKGYLILVSVFLLWACNRELIQINTIENMSPENTPLLHSVTFIETPSKTPIPNMYSFVGLRLKKALQKEFYVQGGYLKGDNLKIDYSFIQIELGEQMARSFYPQYGVGHGSLTLRVIFNNEKKKLGEITINCLLKRQGLDDEISAIAAEIYKYARGHFYK